MLLKDVCVNRWDIFSFGGVSSLLRDKSNI